MPALNARHPACTARPRYDLRSIVSRCALTALLALAAIPASHAACNLDIDGNGRLDGTTDGLLVVRYLLGMRGAALVTGALGTGASRTLSADVESYLASPCAQGGWVGTGSGRLNDTGISFFGDTATTNLSSCPPTLLLLYYSQDCLQGRDATSALNSATDGVAGFSFTKISNSGTTLPATAALGTGPTDWACTYDNITGLMWEVKTTTGRRSSAHSYSWNSSDASNNAGTASWPNDGICADVGQCDTEKFAQLTNLGAGLCGHTDWRMPHVKELEGIAHVGSASSVAIDDTWFPNTPALPFWSGTPTTGVGPFTGAWRVSFASGSAFTSPRFDAVRVRLVRAGR